MAKEGYIVPFTKTVKQLLSARNFYEAVFKSFGKYSHKTNETYSDVVDGSFTRDSKLFIKMKGKVLIFQIKSDQVQLAYPLDSIKEKHQVVKFYITLLNMPPEWRSLSNLSATSSNKCQTF